MCLNFCSTLRDRGCKYSFSLKLGHGFDFSLASEECPPKQAKKRSPSYRRRQERRRADYLQKQSKSSHDKEATASGSSNQDRTTAEAEELNLCPTPIHTTYSIGSMDSEEDDATMENACTNTLAEKSEDGRALQNQRDTNSKESDVHGSDTEGGSDASSAESSSDEGGSDATTEDPESHWEQVSSRRGRGLPGRRQPSPTPSLRRHQINDAWKNQYGKNGRKNKEIFGNPRVTVYAPADVTDAEVAAAVHNADISRLRWIKEFYNYNRSEVWEFSREPKQFLGNSAIKKFMIANNIVNCNSIPGF